MTMGLNQWIAPWPGSVARRAWVTWTWTDDAKWFWELLLEPMLTMVISHCRDLRLVAGARAREQWTADN